ncbi:MAG: GH3 auxin-responsive promoter family protein [Bacteroidetes bacterium]|nr:GH3 auxin-responsive promoter family protein [Bacteroidota bacterium]MBK9414275.1 GH3 auxin-responsive promoter family protein [Bacteroidota bacterium]MBL0030832.1 GH3 auxin-responsive promoter family protein [Bacteroidota bacterium]MBP9789728.1 GH3 auxin-responsive promoter family protein [Bacteroidia bacterium]
MAFLPLLSKPLASYMTKQTMLWSKNAALMQKRIFEQLLTGSKTTSFGKDHWLSSVKSYESFREQVPIRDYEDFKTYIERIKLGEENVLWPGKPLYLSKTSGTTSGVKYIPLTRASIPNHINSTRNALLSYIHETGKAKFLNGKLIFISGSPALETINGIPVGRLSGIVNHHVPSYLRRNQLPTYATNCIEDWEKKVDAIVEETVSQNMTLISGIPPWVQMYFDKLTERTGKKIKDIFPDFDLFIYGGVNYEPYRNKLEQSIGKKVDSIELYPASEGFIAYQDKQNDPSLLLMVNSGIFYEFIPASEYWNTNPTRISLKDVELGVNYAIILNTNAGLWGYSLGDTVKFVSKDPYKILVTGRIKHFISAFGEHVITEEVEKALMHAAQQQHAEIVEFTVAPQVTPENGLPYHEWFIEFAKLPDNMEKFAAAVDDSLQRQNIYYKDLISGNILQPLKIRHLRKDAFISFMRSLGKLGGQNKVPRLSNDRKLANELEKFL